MGSAKKISLYFVDDHPIISESLCAYFRDHSDFEVFGSSTSSDDAYTEIMKHPPDVVVMDIEIPGESPFQVARKIQEYSRGTRVLFFSAYLSDAYILEATTLDTFGYMTKPVGLEELTQGIRTLASGEHAFSRDVLARFPGGIRTMLQNLPKTRLGMLTPREREVLKYIANGYTGKDIALKLSLSARTIDRHKANIMEKLGIHSQVGLTRFAVAEGLCQPLTSSEVGK